LSLIVIQRHVGDSRHRIFSKTQCQYFGGRNGGRPLPVHGRNWYCIGTVGALSNQKISLDAVIKVMKATGRDMSTKYKETSEAGLALSATEC